MSQTKPIVIGVVLIVILLGGAIVVPGLLMPAEHATAVQALEKAELARRQMNDYVPAVALAAARQNLDALKNVDAEKVVSRVEKAMQAYAEAAAKRVQAAQAADRKSGLKSNIRTFAADPNSMRLALPEYEKLVSANEALLTQVTSTAQAAMGESGQTPGVPTVLGIAREMEATNLIAEARQMRTRLAALQNAAKSAALEWSVVDGQVKHYSNIDVSPTEKQLNSDLEQAKAARASGAGDVAALTEQVAKGEAELAKVREDMAAARAALAGAEAAGFKAGDDAAFQAHKAKLLELSGRLSALQGRELTLSAGNRSGATIADGDLIGGAIEGGEVVLGLDELKRRLALATDQLKRLTGGEEALTRQLADATAFGKFAKDEAARFETRRKELEASINKLIEQTGGLNKDALAKEDEALAAARAAVSAFSKARGAAGTLVSAAREQRRELDEEGKNDRLKTIVNDGMIERIADVFEAQATARLGMIYAERALAVESYKAGLEELTKSIKGATYDPKVLQEVIDNSKNEAIAAYSAAVALQEKVAQADRAPWAPQGGLAAMAYSSSKVDPSKAGQYLDTARKALAVALKNEAWPYIRPEVRALRTHLPAESAGEVKPSSAGDSGNSGGDSDNNGGSGGGSGGGG